MTKPELDVLVYEIQSNGCMAPGQVFMETPGLTEQLHIQYDDLKLRPELFQLSFEVIHVAIPRTI